MKHTTKKDGYKAFTLIEIMIAIAIVGILSAVVLVSMQGFGKKARALRAMAQVSSAIPSMVSCWGNGGDVYNPSEGEVVPAGNQICNLATSYGNWPQNGGDLKDYRYTSSQSGGILSKSSWYVRFTNSSDDRRICCNSTMNNCKILDTATTTCDVGNPSY